LVLARLSESVRRALQRVVRELSRMETTSGVGLFGSRSRGDASVESDIDVLVVEKQGLMHERLERREVNGLWIDLDHVPRKWITVSLPSEIDPKLFELLVLYDRDWSLTNAKDWMSRSYHKPERMNIRAEMYLIDSDVYLSRASSALARGDFQSAVVFAGVALESVLKIIIEASLLPFSPSRFVHTLEESTKNLDCHQFFDDFIEISLLQSVDRSGVQHRLGLFKTISDDVALFLQEQVLALDSVHFAVKNQLEYYGNPCFLRGMLARLQGIINSGEYVDACHYLRRVLLNLLENYGWFVATLEGIRLDYTLLFKSLRTLKETPSSLYENVVTVFDVPNVTRKVVEETVDRVKETTLKVRRIKNELLQNAVNVA
jgi:predicted nucleotidyltransferase